MKSRISFLLTLTLLAVTSNLQAQGTAFTYQGQLQNNGSPARGTYNLSFSLFTGSSGAGQVGVTFTNPATIVSNGLFTTAIDFGSGIFNGASYWLEIGVRTNGNGAFATLSPRQKLTPAPYAIFAEGANAAGLTGTIAATNIGNGTITSSQLAANIGLWTLADNNIFYNSGNVGIGTPTPNGSLDVNGGIRARGGPPGAFGVNNNGYAFNGVGDNDSGLFSSANGQLEFYGNAIERMRLASSGYLGIGTSNPASPLHVIGANPFPHLTIAAASNAPYGAFLSIDATATTNGKNYLIFSTGAFAGEGQGKLVIQNHTDGAQIMCLTSNGNVGIGTLAPNYRLSLGNDDANTKLAVWDGGSVAMGFGVGPAQFRIHLPESDNRFSFLDNPGGSNELMTILGTGNVGIGTNNPGSPLWVQGIGAFGQGTIVGLQTAGAGHSSGVFGQSLVPGGNGVFGEADVPFPGVSRLAKIT